MYQNKRQIGSTYEKITGEYLKEQGYEIVTYNFSCKTGEIDIIAKDGCYLVFVEVKYRKDKRQGDPLEAISLRKQRSISKCALYYMKRNRISDVPVRFDVVGILDNQIRLVKDAFLYQE